MIPIDRLIALKTSPDVVGIDFVYVRENQQDLYVVFHEMSATLSTELAAMPSDPSIISIQSKGIGNPISSVPVASCDWTNNPLYSAQIILHLRTSIPSDFSDYALHLDTLTNPATNPATVVTIDPYYNDVTFSFKANCPSDLDCAPPAHECPPDDFVDYPVNYQARDFWSIRQALLDFVSDRHPEWKDRLEADLGMMLVEVIAAMGDEFAYYQDRISREAYLESAAERRSLRRLARLVDYEIHNGKGGTTWLDFQVQNDDTITTGVQVATTDGQTIYEVGRGLSESLTAKAYTVKSDLNVTPAYQWDVNQPCLPANSTSLYVLNITAADFKADDFSNPNNPVKNVLLVSAPADASVPARSWLVKVIRASDTFDVLNNNQAVTLIEWQQAQATPYELEFASLTVHGNIFLATSGQTLEAYFGIGGDDGMPVSPSAMPSTTPPNSYYNQNFSGNAIERAAPDATILTDVPEETGYDSSFLFSLPGSETRDLAWHGHTPLTSSPEVRLFEGKIVSGVWNQGGGWDWRQSFVGVESSESQDKQFTLDEGTWRRITSYRRVDETGAVQEFDHFDYASGKGSTVRFGNGEFGAAPSRGTQFRAIYRLGNGPRDNLAAGTEFQTIGFANATNITKITNPFGITDAVDPETPEHVQHSAPYAFRSERFNAVLEEDYAKAIEKLDWVERAGAKFRWTGSWATLFATPDPKSSYIITETEHTDLEHQLDRYRLAGREAYGMNPRYADLNLDICICVEPRAFRGDVEARVLDALFGHTGLRPTSGFFSSDNWKFGQALERPKLEAAIQAVPGVRAVERICFARNGWFTIKPFTDPTYFVGVDEIVRVSNDRNHPEQGLVTLNMEGGI